MPNSRVRQLLKFIRVFGIAGGIRLWCTLVLQLGLRSSVLELRVPGTAEKIYLRPRDLPIFWQIMVMRENDFQSFPQASRMKDIYRVFLSEGDRPVIVDCGAHIGLSAVWFASRFPEAMIYSVEPDVKNFELLIKNTQAYSNVVALHGGVWNEVCNLEISNPLSGSASFRLREVPEQAMSEGSCALRGYTVDEIVRREKSNRLFLVKMDIEGAEAQVFQDRAEWLELTTMLVIELHDWLLPGQGTSRNFFKRLGENEFDVVLRGENLLLFRAADSKKRSGLSYDNEMLAAKL
jgi:FkbM family methyltransferase